MNNLNKLKPNYNPFIEEELNEKLIVRSLIWINTKEGVDFWNDVDNKYKEFYNDYIMKEEKEKSIKIDIPEGYKIDKEKSTFENIVFKKKEECWRAKETSNVFTDLDNLMNGFYIERNSEIKEIKNISHSFPNRNVFATKKQAKSVLAMAQISQIMVHDKRFGGVVTDEEWNNDRIYKYSITRENGGIDVFVYNRLYKFLAFHTPEQRELFLKENYDLVKDYLMID